MIGCIGNTQYVQLNLEVLDTVQLFKAKATEAYLLGDTILAASYQKDSILDLFLSHPVSEIGGVNPKGEVTQLTTNQRPMMLIFTSKYCRPCHCLKPAINEMADQYGGKADFVVIAGDPVEERYLDGYTNSVKKIYSDGVNSSSGHLYLGRLLGLPSIWYLDTDRTIQGFSIGAACERPGATQGAPLMTAEAAHQLNLKVIMNGLATIQGVE